VLLSSGDIDLAAAERSTALSLRHVRAGASPAEALRRARVEIAADAATAHPSAWALLRVIGVGADPLFEPPPSRRPAGWAAVALIALVVALALRARRRDAQS
jgi:hypothetical protein